MCYYLCSIADVFDSIGMTQGEDQVRELAPLEFCDELFVLFVGELAGIVFEDGLGRFAGGCVEEHDRCDIVIAAILSSVDIVICSHKEMPSCRALNPRLTSWLVRPFTSLEAAQSSSTNRVLVPAKRKLTSRSQASISCCRYTITYMCGSRSTKWS